VAASTFDSTKLSLSDLLEDVTTGKLQLPEFQRGWVWDDNHIRDLIASIAVGFPIGAIMLMETGGEVRFKARPVEGVETTEHEPERLILDGQQRLTSLFQSLRSGKVVRTRDERKRELERWYYLAIKDVLDPQKELIEAVRSVPGDKVTRTNFGRDVLEDLSNPEAEFESFLFPLARAFDPNPWKRPFLRYHDRDPDVFDMWDAFEEQVLDSLKTYQLPVITLKRGTPREAVCLVFEKVNTGGVALNVFELLTATFAAEEEGFNLRDDWEERRAAMLQGAGQAPAKSVLGGVEPSDFLQAVTLLVTLERREADRVPDATEPRAVSCKRRDVLALTKADYDRWATTVTEAFVQAARFLHGEHVFDRKFIPYQTQLVPLAALIARVGDRWQDHGNREKLRQWYWCGVFGELYGSSTETRFANDLLDVLAWIEGYEQLPRTVVDANLSPERLDRLRTRNSAAYRGIYVLLLREGARDWRTGELSDIQNYHGESIDIHHIFPRKWCRSNGIPEHDANSIINKTPLTSRTNRIVGGDAPSRYLPALEGKSGSSAEAADGYLASHMIDPTALRRDDFASFWNQRRKALLTHVGDVMGKQLQSDEEDTLAEDEVADEDDELV
jgi:hypothetical protein